MPDETTTEPTYTTSAKRLFAVLTAMKSTPGNYFYTVVPLVLQVAPSSAIGLTADTWRAIRAERLAAVMIEDFVREVKDSHLPQSQQDMSLVCLAGVVEAFSPLVMGTDINSARAKIRDIDLVQLQFVDVLLRDRIAEKEMTANDLADLTAAVELALSALNESSLPHALRDFITAQLLSIRIAIQQYQFRGMRGVEEALAGYMGSYAAGRVEESSEITDEEKLTLKSVLEKGQTIVNLARGAHWALPHLLALAHHVTKLRGQLG